VFRARTEQEKSMARLVSGIIVGFFSWVMAWVGGEKILSALWPEGFGAPQRAFEAAITHGGQFTADTSLLLTHMVLGSIVSLMAGCLAVLIAGGNKRAPLVLGFLLLALGLLKATLSWPYVPLWYHLAFTALLLPMTIIGGKLMRRVHVQIRKES
jgi:hypothetical protein